jgi:hypothetical protein
MPCWPQTGPCRARASGSTPWSLAARATRQLRGPWPNGLLKGYTGIVCLALDLARERQPRGFPLVEA